MVELCGVAGAGEKHEFVRDDHVLCDFGSSFHVDYLWSNQ